MNSKSSREIPLIRPETIAGVVAGNLNLEVAPRSRIPSISVIGTGTGMVESLSSVLSRLCEKVPLTQHGFLKDCLENTRFPEGLAFQTKQELYQQASLMRSNAATISGSGIMAGRAVALLEQASGMTGLRCSTLLPLAAHVDERSMRRVHAWCPVCLWDRQEKALPYYRPLLWFIQGVDCCPTHHVRLETKCRACGDSARSLTACDWLGQCPKCSAPFGRSLSDYSSTEFVTAPLERFVAQSVAEVLGDLAAFDGAKPRFAENIRVLTGRLGTYEQVADLVRVRSAGVRSWSRGTHRPGLILAARCAFAAGGRLVDWLLGEPQMTGQSSSPIPEAVARRISSVEVYDVASLARVLEAVIQRDLPTNLKAVARSARIDVSRLRKLLPELAEAVDRRWERWVLSETERIGGGVQAAVNAACWKLYDDGIPLSPSRMQALLPGNMEYLSGELLRAYNRWCSDFVSTGGVQLTSDHYCI